MTKNLIWNPFCIKIKEKKTFVNTRLSFATWYQRWQAPHTRSGLRPQTSDVSLNLQFSSVIVILILQSNSRKINEMNAESLIASAAINIGLALVIICLFSIFRKHHSNANIYYPRRLSLRHQHTISFDHSFTRFLPSLDWIRDAVRVTEDEILCSLGLDALVLIRFFKLG